MRILRIHSYDGIEGGAEEYVRAVVDGLARRGIETRVVLLVSHPPENPPANARTLVVPGPGARRAVADLRAGDAIFSALKEEYRTFRPDLVHLHHFDAAFHALARFAAHVDRPLFFTAHDAELVCPNGQLVRPPGIVCEGGILPRCQFTGCPVGLGVPYELVQRYAFDRWVAPRVRAYLCPSTALCRYLEAHGYRPTVHLPSFVRMAEETLRAPTPDPGTGAPPTIGFLGRIEGYKGIDDLLRAFGVVRRILPAARLDLAGGGSGLEPLRARIRAEGLESSVLVRGPVRGPAKEAWFGGVHIVVSPSSRFENTPLSLMEAMAHGRPVVGTDIGGIPEVLGPDLASCVVPMGDVLALAKAIVWLLSNPTERERLGRLARTRALDEYTETRHLGRLVATYEEALGKDGVTASD
ncbi:MAG: glycosyltransferase family 4 protein [Thermoplasmata archaeon]